MKRVSRHFGPAGLALIILGGLGYAMAPQFPGFYVIPWALAALALILYALFNPQAVRGVFFSRSVRYGAGSAFSVLLVLGILVFAAALTAKHSARLDLTSDRRFSLAPQTLKILASLPDEVRVTGFFQGQGAGEAAARTLFEQYAHASDRFKFELVDPDRNPARAKNAGINRYDVTLIEASGRSEKISKLSEEILTNAILRVIRPQKKVIYFLTGHGERDIENEAKNGLKEVRDLLAGQNYEVRPLLLLRTDKVPEDAAVVVAAGPLRDLVDQETEMLDLFMKQGGHIFFMLDPETAPGLARFLAGWGVRLGDDIIVDKMSRLFGGDYLMPLLSKYADHPVTRDFNMASFFPLARSVSAGDNAPAGVKVEPLAFTGQDAWAETDLQRLNAEGKAAPDEGQDQFGPVSLAVVGTVAPAGVRDNSGQSADIPQGEGKFIVFGDSDFATNAYLNLQGNSDLFLNSLSWLAEESDLVAIRAKDTESKPLLLSATQARLVFWLPVVVLPLFVLAFGLFILVRHRREQP